MSQPTYGARGIVLRKTKLGEGDLVVTLLSEDGSQLRAVAKGARKPTSPFASRLELYSVADALLARGRSLDIVKEARLVEGNERLRRDLERAVCAAPVAELSGCVSQDGLENPRLFALTRAALSSLGRVEVPFAPAIAAGHLLKALAFAGLRPSLDACAVCGRELGAPAPEGLAALAASSGRVVLFDDLSLAAAGFRGETWDAQCLRIVETLPQEVYVSFDIDGLSYENCPHTGTPVAGGLGFNQAVWLLDTLVRSGRRIVGFDVVEVTPAREERIDAITGARVLWKLCNLTLKSNVR